MLTYGICVACARAMDDFTIIGEVPVDAGMLLVVDPCHLPPDVLKQLVTPNKYGVTLAVMVKTPFGDGGYAVEASLSTLTIRDPWSDPMAVHSRPFGEATESDIAAFTER